MSYMELMDMSRTCIECRVKKEPMAFKREHEICRACWLYYPEEKRRDYMGKHLADIKVASYLKKKKLNKL